MNHNIVQKSAVAMLALLALGALVFSACSDDEADAGNEGAPNDSAQTEAHRAVLDSLPQFTGAVMVREYLTKEGNLGREYGTTAPPEQAASEVGVFYRDYLRGQGWQTDQEHAAVSAYSKDGRVLQVLRYGANTPAPAEGETTIVTARPAVPLNFFFGLEVGLKN